MASDKREERDTLDGFRFESVDRLLEEIAVEGETTGVGDPFANLGCPSDEDLAHYRQGELPPKEHERIQAHLDFCKKCLGKVSRRKRTAENRPERRLRFAPPSRWFLPTAATIVLAAALLLCAIPGSADGLGARFDPPGEGNGRTFHRGAPLHARLSTDEAVHIIVVTLNGAGEVNSRFVKGPRDGLFSRGDRIPLDASVAGPVDFFIVPVPRDRESPHDLNRDLLAYFITDRSIARENRIRNIKGPLKVFGLESVHLHGEIR